MKKIVKQSLGSMAQEAARAALLFSSATAVQGGGCGPLPPDLRAAVTTPSNPAPILAPASLTFDARCALDTTSGTRTITITASYSFAMVVPFLRTAPSLSATAKLAY
jgi:hypothetical protein